MSAGIFVESKKEVKTVKGSKPWLMAPTTIAGTQTTAAATSSDYSACIAAGASLSAALANRNAILSPTAAASTGSVYYTFPTASAILAYYPNSQVGTAIPFNFFVPTTGGPSGAFVTYIAASGATAAGARYRGTGAFQASVVFTNVTTAPAYSVY